MAFTKTPETSTYSQQDIQLTRVWNSRQADAPGSKDEQYLNCFTETIKNTNLQDKRQYIVKRPGVSLFLTPPVSGDIRGAFFWQEENFFIYCISDDVYVHDFTTNVVTTLSAVFGTTSGKVGFTTFLYETGIVDVVATDGTTLVTIDSALVVTPSVSPDLPVPHLPKPLFLDGYLFLLKEDTANLYNSDLDAPLDYTGDFITAEIDGDIALDIDRLNNYLVVFGNKTIEYFWDAGNETGSPLNRNDTPVKINTFIGGLSKMGNALYYIGYNDSNQLDVFKLQDFAIEAIGSPTITRYLTSVTQDLDTFNGAVVPCLGHSFYVLNAGFYTFVYDLEMKYWSRWSHQSSNEFDIKNPITVRRSNAVVTVFNIGTSNVFRFLDDTVFQDNFANFPVQILTEPSDFGTLNRKTMSRLSVVADRPDSDSNLLVQWSDDDFQTFNTGVEINLNQQRPSLNRLGTFRQRSFKLTYTDNFPMRIQKLEVNINKGRG